MSSKPTIRNTALAAALALAWCAGAAAAEPATIDWGKVPAKTITLFYPGQSSHEWLQAEHKGGKGKAAVKRGEACIKCHDGEQKTLGASLVKGGDLEPTPVPGKPGSVDLQVQVAYDANNAYFRFQWKTLNPFPGSEYPLLRYDGKDWKPYGQQRLNKAVRDGTQPGIYEDRLSMMVDDGKVAGFAKQGCWLTCHTGERDMPGQASTDEAKAAIKKNDVRKYLPASRSDAGDWRTMKSGDEIAKLKQAGAFLDLIQWRAHRSNPVGMGDDGYVLEYRNFDEGKNPFASNVDPLTKAPKYMWDKSKMGYSTTTAGELRKREHVLVREQNVVAFEGNGGFKAGDLLPSYYVSRAEAKGSAADNQAVGTWKDGGWTVVLSRPLGLANADDKPLREGGVYTIGFAVHDDNVTTRGHYVSFPVSVGFGAEAEVKAVKLP